MAMNPLIGQGLTLQSRKMTDEERKESGENLVKRKENRKMSSRVKLVVQNLEEETSVTKVRKNSVGLKARLEEYYDLEAFSVMENLTEQQAAILNAYKSCIACLEAIEKGEPDVNVTKHFEESLGFVGDAMNAPYKHSTQTAEPEIVTPSPSVTK